MYRYLTQVPLLTLAAFICVSAFLSYAPQAHADVYSYGNCINSGVSSGDDCTSSSISASPQYINSGQGTQISWYAHDVTYCILPTGQQVNSSGYGGIGDISGSAVLYPGASTDYQITCQTQYYGIYGDQAEQANTDGHTSSDVYVNVQQPAQNPPVTASCGASPYNVNTYQTVTWTGYGGGGTGYYSYYWSGEALNGNSGQTTYAAYGDAGTKAAYLTVVDSNGVQGYATCYAQVSAPPPPPPSYPDLYAVTPVTLSGVPGQAISLPGTIYNQGSGGAASSPVKLQICDGGCAGLYAETNTYAPYIGSGGGAAVYSSYTFNSPGTYYYRFCANTAPDWSNSITETNYGNNCGNYGTIIVGAPDLTASTGGPVTTSLQTSTQFSSVVSNVGNASAGYFNNILQTCDGGCTNWNHVVAASDVGGLGAQSAQTIYGYDSFPSDGAYYYRFCANYNTGWGNSVTESNYGNNCGAWQSVTVATADIIAYSGTAATATFGAPVTLSATVGNQGNTGTGSFPNTVRVCDSGCTHVDNTIAANVVGSLAKGGTATISASYTPTNQSYPQLYYSFCGDSNDSIVESNYGNNCGAWQTLTVQPPGPTNPVTTCSTDGTHVSFSWTASPGATNYYPRMYYPTGSQCTSFGWQVYTVDGQTCYPNPDNWTATSVNNFPITPGQNYTWAVAAGNSAGVNWNSALSANFACAGQPDLAATQGLAAATVVNTPVTLSAGINNIGNGAAGAFPNIVQICDGSCANISTVVAATSINSLAANGGQTVTASYTPTNSSYPNLYYRFCGNMNTSFTNIVTESNYSNNCGAWQNLTVTTPTPSCNLTANPSSVTQGGSSVLTWTSTYETSCTGSGFSTGGAANGSTSVQPSNGSQSYGLQCTGTYGTCNAPPATIQAGCSGTPTSSVSASPTRVHSGAQTTITWSGTGVNSSCVLTKNGSTIATVNGNSCTVGAQNTPDTVTSTSKYCSVCDGGTPVCTTVNVIPNFQEF